MFAALTIASTGWRVMSPWTTFHLAVEREAALIPVAYTIGVDFKPAPRAPLASMVHWDHRDQV